MKNDSLKEIFLSEAEELLVELEEGLVALEEDPDDIEIINKVFRASHTIKGSAGLSGFDSIVDLTHVMENVLDRLRDGKLKVSKALISILLKSTDILKSMLELVSNDKPAAKAKGYEQNLQSLRRFMGIQNLTPAKGAGKAEAIKEASEPGIFNVHMKFHEDILESGQDPYMLIEELAGLGEIIRVEVDCDDLPDFYDLNPTKMYLSWELILKANCPKSEVENVFIFVTDENHIQVNDITNEYKDGVDTSMAERRVGELLVEKGEVTEDDIQDVLKTQKKTGELLVETGKVSETKIEKILAKQDEARKVVSNSTIRVDTEKLDKLVNLVGELVTGVAQVNQFAKMILESGHEDLIVATESLDQISRDLQEQVMLVRMVPVEATFNRFKRVVRDLADDLGKKIRLEMSGTETELDKNVIEQLADPLKHLIRNCADHAIESPDMRMKLGKDEVGTIWLRASQREGNIFVEITDDGSGIDQEAILAKAVARGFCTANDSLSDNEIFDFLFKPGFSTTESVTEVSGRGVGLDVVRRNIEAMRGSVEVRSKKGEGTTFRIKLPLTLAIIDGMNVQVGSEILTIPLLSIVEQIRPNPDEVKTVEGKGEVMDVRGDYLPMLRLHEVFDFMTNKTKPSEALVVVLENEGRRFCVLVDDVLGQQQAVIKALDKNFKMIEGVSGATILGDGSISLIVDVHGMERMALA